MEKWTGLIYSSFEIPSGLQRGEKHYCLDCNDDTYSLSAYKQDTLFGQRLLIPRNECWKLCSQCGNITGKIN